MISAVWRYKLADLEWEQIKPGIPEEQGTGSQGRFSQDSETMQPEFINTH